MRLAGVFDYMRPLKEQNHVTESYVCSPPALKITDESGAVWTLGFDMTRGHVNGHYSFDVLRNGRQTGEIASHIERRNGRIRCLTSEGWKRWTGRSFF